MSKSKLRALADDLMTGIKKSEAKVKRHYCIATDRVIDVSQREATMKRHYLTVLHRLIDLPQSKEVGVNEMVVRFVADFNGQGILTAQVNVADASVKLFGAITLPNLAYLKENVDHILDQIMLEQMKSGDKHE